MSHASHALDTGSRAALLALTAARREATIALCRELVAIPSPSGDERRVADRTAREMESCGLDVTRDTWGNVLGVLPATSRSGTGAGAILLNAHLDHVDVGDASRWSHGPHEAAIVGDRLFGRGSTDTKSSVAAQIHALAALRESGLPRSRDIVVAAVVQEEVGGLGTAGLLDGSTKFDAAIIGEPSENALSFGHRGRTEVEVTFHGRAAHASRPDRGLNPHAAMARFILDLDALAHDTDERFGSSTAAPTLVSARPASPNVIPSELALTLDWRHVASESPEVIRERVQGVASRAAGQSGATASVRTPTRTLTSYTGLSRQLERVSRAFSTDPEASFFSTAQVALTAALGRPATAVAWDFASDGGWLAARGVPCVGFGPGDMKQMHALDESVSLDLLAESVAGFAFLAIELCNSLPMAGEPRP